MKTATKIGIVGCGKMGKDLFDYLIQFPFEISIVCNSLASKESIEKAFNLKQKRALKYKLISQEEFDFKIKNTCISTSLTDLSDCDIIIESITEDEGLKRKLFSDLDLMVKPDCIIASNTSSINLKRIISENDSGRNLVGLHFFFPIALKNLVEFNILEATNLKAISKVESFLEQINKFYIKLDEKDHFLINRLILRIQAGCCQLLSEGGLTVEQIDGLIKKHFFPLGIFELFDHVGNDIMLASVKNYLATVADPEFFEPLIQQLEQKVKDRSLGLKTAKGFYQYPIEESSQNTELKNEEAIIEKLARWYLEPIYDAHQKGICTKEQLEHIITEYLNAEKSPFDLGKEYNF